MAEYAKPLPVPDAATRPYWEACRRHELRLQRCLECRRFRHFPAPSCGRCGSVAFDWQKVSGRGVIYAFTVVHHSVFPGLAQETPYVVVWVELDEQPGLRVLTRLVEAGVDEARVGARVEVVFEDVTPEVSLPQFRLVR